MRHFLFALLLLLCQAALALDTSESADSRFGHLQIQPDAKGVRSLHLGSTLLYSDSGYFAMTHVLQLGDKDVVLIKKTPATPTPKSYFFITLSKAQPAVLSQTFVEGDRPVLPRVQDDKIIAALGLRAGNAEIVTYQNGQIALQQTALQGKKANEEYCDYLYKQIYYSYVAGKQCSGAPEASVFGEGESPAEVYRRMMDSDPRLNEANFQSLSKDSCQKGKTVRYAAFRKQVCGW